MNKKELKENKSSNTGKTSTIAIALFLSLLLFSSAFLIFSNFQSALAQTTGTSIPSDLLQYEWKMGTSDAQRSNFAEGPSPDVPNIQWKTSIPNLRGGPYAFNGLVLVQTYDFFYSGFLIGGNTIALDAGTGNIVWNITGIGNIAKLDDTYMLIGTNCYRISDGSLVWMGPSGFGGQIGTSAGVAYIPELKINIAASGSTCVAWDLADPSEQPTLLWDRTTESDAGKYGAETARAYGNGVLVVGTYLNFLRGVNATTGKTIWTTKAPVTIYGMSTFENLVVQGGSEGTMRAFNLTTGEIEWTFNSGNYYSMWSWAPAVAYGMVYEHNQDTYTYAINATTGEMVWKAKGPGIAYSNYLTVAGGKVFINSGENQYRDFATGEFGYSRFDALDAYTGEVVWSAPFENGAPNNFQCNAYGNLYVLPTTSVSSNGTYVYSGSAGQGTTNIGEVWCIGNTPKDWPMFLSDPEHSADSGCFGPTNLALKWKFATGGEIASSPVFVNGVGYVGSGDGKIYAFDASTGEKLWNFTAGLWVYSTMAVANDKVYTGAENGRIYCLDASTGNKLWENPAPGTELAQTLGIYVPIASSPIIYNGKVYVGASNGIVYCLDDDSGTITWQVQTGGPIYATPTIVDNTLYIGSSTQPNGALLKLDVNTGQVLLNVSIPYTHRTYGWGDNIIASPIVENEMIFVRTGVYTNYALNATTGSIIWEYDEMTNPGTPMQDGGTLSFGAPLYKHGLIYINDYYGITALNALNGSMVWHSYTSRENLALGISYSYGRIYAANEAGILNVIDAQTGEQLGYYYFHNFMHSTPIPYNNSLYVGTDDGNIYCLEEYVAPTIASAEFSLSLSTDSITKGDVLYITGGISNVGSVPATLTLDKPDSTYVDVPFMTDENGNFMVIYTPDISGEWTVTAWWDGDDLHTASASETLSLSVTDPEVPEPTPTPLSLSDMYLLPATAGIIAAVVVIGLVIILMLRKR